MLEKAQSSPVFKYPAEISCVDIEGGRWGGIPVYFAAPKFPENKSMIRNVIAAAVERINRKECE